MQLRRKKGGFSGECCVSPTKKKKKKNPQSLLAKHDTKSSKVLGADFVV